VLSTAYWFGSGSGPAQPGEYEKVRAETEWVAGQVARHPDRLVGLCSFNPLKNYALDALEQCAANPHIRGLKQHFGDAHVDLRNPEHLARVERVFRAANRHRLPIVVDVRTSDPAYGAEHSRIFLDRLVAAAPDVSIQIAHLAGSGPGYNSDEAFAVFAEAAAAGDPRMRNVYTDVATVVTQHQEAPELALIARRLRQFGLERVLYGSDHPASTEITPEMGWVYFRRLPLTDAEFRLIADNLAPYFH
jgi:predicted TIM-barrel fold metal-dependent hydrolase